MDFYELSLEDLISASEHNECAQILLAKAYALGKEVERDFDEAFKLCSLAIDNFRSREFYMREDYPHLDLMQREIFEVFSIFEAGMKEGIAACQYAVACFYCYGWGVEKDDVIAKDLFILAARQGHKDAILCLRELY